MFLVACSLILPKSMQASASILLFLRSRMSGNPIMFGWKGCSGYTFLAPSLSLCEHSLFLQSRISGNPVMFGWKGAVMEGFIFGGKVKSMALGISLTKINLADIIMKLFRKRLSNCWLTELNVCKFLLKRTLEGDGSSFTKFARGPTKETLFTLLQKFLLSSDYIKIGERYTPKQRNWTK